MERQAVALVGLRLRASFNAAGAHCCFRVQAVLLSQASCRATAAGSAQRARRSTHVVGAPATFVSAACRVAALFYGRGVSVDGHDVEPDLAMELELRDELLVACRQLLIGIGTREAAALVAHIDALLDLDDEVSPGSQR
jgi:hypothetical protein